MHKTIVGDGTIVCEANYDAVPYVFICRFSKCDSTFDLMKTF